MKKIVFAVPTLTGGGAERVVSVWAGQLNKIGYEVFILLLCRSKNEYYVDERIKLYSVSSDEEAYKYLNNFSKIRVLRKFVKEIKPDYVISFLPHVQVMMFIATLGSNIKRIETVRLSPWDQEINGKLRKVAWKLCFVFATKIIVQTEEQKLFFGKRQQRKCVVIPNPLSDVYKNIRKKTDEYNTIASKFVAAGRIDKQKNYVLMIEAFAKAKKQLGKNPDISLDIYGSGNEKYEKQLIELINELELSERIRLKGRTNCLEKELIRYDAFLMSSDYEGMPNSLVEAMAVGLVCISTDCRTGPTDMIEDGKTGFLTETGNVDAYARIIMKVARESREKRMQMGMSAAKTIRTITSKEHSLKKLVEIIEG